MRVCLRNSEANLILAGGAAGPEEGPKLCFPISGWAAEESNCAHLRFWQPTLQRMSGLERVPAGGVRGGPPPDPVALFLYRARGGDTAEMERMINEKLVRNADVYEPGIGMTALMICSEKGDE